MYKLEYSPVARQDMLGIIRYISKKPTNPSAADRPAVDLTEANMYCAHINNRFSLFTSTERKDTHEKNPNHYGSITRVKNL